MDEAALAGWQAPRRSTPDGQPRYSELAIELVLPLRLVFHLALRQAEEFARSVLPCSARHCWCRTTQPSAGEVAPLPDASRV